MDTLHPTKQKVSSNKPFTRSNSGPINNVPEVKPTPVQMNICDISAVLLDVQTSISGSDVVIIPKLAPYDHTHNLSVEYAKLYINCVSKKC